jgi:hypothetical protein
LSFKFSVPHNGKKKEKLGREWVCLNVPSSGWLIWIRQVPFGSHINPHAEPPFTINASSFHIFCPQELHKRSLLLFGAVCHVSSHVKPITVLPSILPTKKNIFL